MYSVNLFTYYASKYDFGTTIGKYTWRAKQFSIILFLTTENFRKKFNLLDIYSVFIEV